MLALLHTLLSLSLQIPDAGSHSALLSLGATGVLGAPVLGSEEAGAAVQLCGATGVTGLSAGGGRQTSTLPGAAVLDQDVSAFLAASPAGVGQWGEAPGVPAPHIHPVLQRKVGMGERAAWLGRARGGRGPPHHSPK